MLRLRNICKYYKYGKNKKIILDDINLDFIDNQLVFILGKSGSGKTTLLSIIAANLMPDEGDIFFDGKNITKQNENYLNYYRNNIVGYIYQDYNLIDYMTVYDNIMIGCNYDDYKYSIDSLLEEFSMSSKKYSKVSKLSGGEKQRVAIIRTLINNPRIILCDEPTGALDQENGRTIMEMLRKISKDRIVLVVSHDTYLANKYADRIINISDGKISNGVLDIKEEDYINNTLVKKKRFKVFKLASKNLFLKKWRNLVTSLAISLGFISMFLVLSIGNNFNKELSDLEKSAVSVFPVSIKNGIYNDKNVNEEKMLDKIYRENSLKYLNKIDKNYLDYLDSLNIDMNTVYHYDWNIPYLSDNYKFIDSNNMKIIPSKKYIVENYDIISGRNILNDDEILIKLDNNFIKDNIMDGFNMNNSCEYGDLIGRKIKIIDNDNYFFRNDNQFYLRNDLSTMYEDSEIELTIVGIIREKEDNIGDSFIYYDASILNKLFEKNSASEIVKAQSVQDSNILGIDLDKEEMLSFLGSSNIPSSIDIYVKSINDKELLINKLDNYNRQYKKVIYEDIISNNIKIVTDFINIIKFILIMFSLIAIIISSIMTGIITSIRVLERRKEIGILRSLGASRKDIRRLFNIENKIIGVFSSLVGLIILFLFRDFINILIKNIVGVDNLFSINIYLFIILMIFNSFIILISGSIPARRASKLEICECLYNR